MRYRYTPSPLTLFKGVKKLSPGTKIVVENGKIRKERWWNYTPSPFLPPPSVKQAEEELLHIYDKTIKRQLISDVPVGLLLSGGMDSGLLLALMNHYGEEWKTFTVGYGSSFKDDELADAAETASLFNSDHISVYLSRSEFENSLSRIIGYLEEPIASSSIVPMYHVCKRASEVVKVALVGQGPDELFGGYKRHLGIRYGYIWRALPSKVREVVKGFLTKYSRSETIRRSLYSLDVDDRMQRYQQVFSLLPDNEINNLFLNGLPPIDTGSEILKCWESLIPLLKIRMNLEDFSFLKSVHRYLMSC